MPQGERRTLDVVSKNIDLVQIFESQEDGILVTKVKGYSSQLQIVWDCFRYAEELSFLRQHLKTFLRHVILLKCDFSIVRNSILNAYALFCKEYLSRNGLGNLLTVYTPDDAACTQWADMLLSSSNAYGREWHTARVHRMMNALFVQGYCLPDLVSVSDS